MVEQRPFKALVVGSSPTQPTTANLAKNMTSSASANSAKILFYDSDCGICTAFANWAETLIEKHHSDLQLIPYQAPGAEQDYPDLDWGHVDEGVQAILPNGEVLKDAAAIAACLRNFPGWSFLGKVMTWPVIQGCAQAGYRLVALNRIRLSGWLGLQACKLKPPAPR